MSDRLTAALRLLEVAREFVRDEIDEEDGAALQRAEQGIVLAIDVLREAMGDES